jgi:hypothetical protein
MDRGGGAWENAASKHVDDPAFLRARNWAQIRDLRSRITGLESDALHQDELADQLEHTGNGNNNAINKIFNAVGTVSAVTFHVEAAKYRAEAARLREQLAKLEPAVGPAQ